MGLISQEARRTAMLQANAYWRRYRWNMSKICEKSDIVQEIYYAYCKKGIIGSDNGRHLTVVAQRACIDFFRRQFQGGRSGRVYHIDPIRDDLPAQDVYGQVERRLSLESLVRRIHGKRKFAVLRRLAGHTDRSTGTVLGVTESRVNQLRKEGIRTMQEAA